MAKKTEVDCIHNHGVGCYKGADCTHCGYEPQEKARRNALIDEMVRKGESHICIKKKEVQPSGNSNPGTDK